MWCVITSVVSVVGEWRIHARSLQHANVVCCHLIVEGSDLRALLGQLFLWVVYGHPEMEMTCSPQRYSNKNNFESHTHGRGSGWDNGGVTSVTRLLHEQSFFSLLRLTSAVYGNYTNHKMFVETHRQPDDSCQYFFSVKPYHINTTSCDVRVQLQNPEQIHVLRCCRNVGAQHGSLLTSSPALNENINAYYYLTLLTLYKSKRPHVFSIPFYADRSL